MNKLSRKMFIVDIVLSFIAFALPVFVMYFCIQPGIARVFSSSFQNSEQIYGAYLTTLAILQFLDSSFIGALSNLRLINSNKDEAEEDGRSVSIIFLMVTLFFISLVLLLALVVFGSFNLEQICLTLMVLLFMAAFDYFLVEFRVTLNYKLIVIANLVVIAGYCIGFIVFGFTYTWQIIYIFGYGFGCFFLFFKQRLWRLSFENAFPSKYMLQYLKLAFSNIISNIVAYGDRLVLFGLMGANNVSIYASAAVASKTVSFVTTPFATVLLSYLAKMESLKLSSKQLLGCLLALFAAMSLTFLVFVSFSRLMTSFLYPQWSSNSLQYIPLIVLGIVFLSFANLINTVILRFSSSNYQLIVSSMRLLVYFICTIVLTSMYGLLGFCLGVFITEAVRFFVIVIIFIRTHKL